ncbi:MAG TPA: sigma-70 family RNA polymerase sigma factor [Steroidobacteraceae bacterium]|nr:sigma-70 family RNA polymerase sigma factor [Steroidobacteraceae bacterium]
MSQPAAARSMSESAAAAAEETAASDVSLESALARAQRGEIAAFRELIRAHQDAVYTLALRMLKVPEDAEELTQDVFVSAHRHLGKITCATHLLFWLRRTVCHRAIDRLRRRPLHATLPLDTVEEVPAADASRDPMLERRLRDLVLRLPPMARAVILLKYQEDLDPSEIATTLGMPLNTVKSHLKRSLVSLRAGCDELRPLCAGSQP